MTSDVDLAIENDQDIRSTLLEEFEQSNLPYTFDIVLYDHQMNEKLRDAIDREGKLLFCVEAGRSVMTVERIRLKEEDYHRALLRLQTALKKEADLDDMYLDATIQRFEFCFELAWKLMKAILEYEGIEANSPRSSIREGWKQGLISDAEEWLDMMEKRNLSSHTYDENVARDIYHEVRERYADLLEVLDRRINQWLMDVNV
ncbi:nucleotidyltransferase substrate-binding family protein [Selenomonas sp. oral taxon 138 str. F0429]|nr:nucleotidyltransferase substrate-binding family protein [Selenomonas sp. oral taxon 138 str. F0429]